MVVWVIPMSFYTLSLPQHDLTFALRNRKWLMRCKYILAISGYNPCPESRLGRGVADGVALGRGVAGPPDVERDR